MKEKLMPYRWIAYVLAWYIFQMYPVYLQMTSTSEEYLVTLFLISVVVILFCSYKFGSEKGKVLGILMFLTAVLIDVFVALFTFAMLLGMNWHN
ncbi:NRAMP family Mn2+/Fe2+ transporter [Prevotella fusca]